MLNGINGMLRNNKTKYSLFVLVFQIVRIFPAQIHKLTYLIVINNKFYIVYFTIM